jgi:Ca2+-binding EF-hand superfamily protein
MMRHSPTVTLKDNSMRSILLAIVGLIVVTASANAQVGGVNLRELFVRLDANGDQVIEKSEVPDTAMPAFEQLLKLADTNKDGKIEVEEYREMSRGMQAGMTPAERFKAMDKNNDGKVSRAEFLGLPTMFDRIDANKDGVLDKDELKPLVAQGPAGTRIMAMDKNGDGKVSRSEYLGPIEMFDRLDTNADGQIDKDEAAKAATAMYQRLTGMDKNGDGKLSLDEFQGPPARFKQLDANGDGFVTFEEIREAGTRGGNKPAAAKPKTDAVKPKPETSAK